MLEAVMDKRRIFEIYLNVIEWGNGVFGAEAAARHYFRVKRGQLYAPNRPPGSPRWCPIRATTTRHREARGLLRKTEIILGRMNDAEIP